MLIYICSIFREPVSVDSKPSTKSDPTAPSRSSIRRQRSIRYSRHPQLISNIRGAHGQSTRPTVPQPPRIISRTSSSREPRSSRDHGDERRESSSPNSLLSTFNRREVGQRLLRDALRHGNPGRRMRIPRESTLRFEMPSPPWSASDHSGSSPGGNGPGTVQSRHMSLTPRFAPAYPFTDQDLGQRSPESLPRPERPSLSEDSLDSNMPLLRRVGHRSVTEANNSHSDSRQPSVDGLGDRQRSPSPPDDNNENDTWETLLTTITPDDHLPSADSSFTSATASATNALSRNYGLSSANTSFSPSFNSNAGTARLVLDPYPAEFFTCDIPSDGSDTEAEFDDSMETSSRERRRHSRRNDADTPRNTGQEQANHSHDSQSSFSFRRDGADPDLQQMQAILDRLARREGIPDEWWAAAGLSRSIGQRLGVNVDLPSTDIGDTPANGQ